VKLYMLDTNTVSHLIRQQSGVMRQVLATPMSHLCISAITAGELAFGLAKRPEATRLHAAVREFMRRVDVLPWDATIAERYGVVRATESHGRNLSQLDHRIAAHAIGADAVLVTNDKAFVHVPGLEVEDWAI